MSFPFDLREGLIIVRAEMIGPSGNMFLRLALDTGATTTMVNVAPLITVGYDPSLSADRVQVTTGSGIEFVPLVEVSRMKALGARAFSLSGLEPHVANQRGD